MKKHASAHSLTALLLAATAWLAGGGRVYGQFRQNTDTIKIDSSGYPTEIQKGYQLFRRKCNECHGLDTSLKPSMSPAQWAFEVKRMQAMPSSQFNEKQAAAIVAFLNYDEEHRKALTKASASEVAAPQVSAGQQLYQSQDCDVCHRIGGQGGTAGPDLTDVGKRLSQDQLRQVIQQVGSGNSPEMPHPPPHLTDEQINGLVDYLATLKGH
jgi:mono/diheme cytochrome c family protein